MLPLASVQDASAPTVPTAIDARLKPAAHEFEACLMKELLEPMQRNALFDEGKDPSGSEGSGNALMSYGSEALARAISERGGFGIAAKIIRQLEGRRAHEAGSPAPENSLGDGGKRTHGL